MMLLLLWQRGDAAEAVRDALQMCAATVIPALFPFFVASSLFVGIGAAQLCGQALRPVLGRALGCSGAAVSAFVLGALGGYPSGARAVGELTASGYLRREEARRALAYCSNCGPAFVLGVCGSRFHAPQAPWCLLAIHLLAAVATAQFFRGKTRGDALPDAPSPSLARAAVQSVTGGTAAMLSVCAFVVTFQVGLRLLFGNAPIPASAAGFFELTGGMLRLTDDRAGFITAAALIGWGGVCVHCQTAAVLNGTGLSLRYYLPGKALQAALSALMALAVSPWLF